jgi:membrane protein YqaA with SNARE-associated domain
MHGIAAGGAGVWVVLAWAFAEGTVWFIAPDFVVIVLSVFAPSVWRRLVVAALVGSLIGGTLCWALNSVLFEAMGRVLAATPFVSTAMAEVIDGWYTEHGHLAVAFQAFSFMPFKLWTRLAVEHGFNPVLYFAIVMVSRAVRFGLSAWIASVIGRRCPRLVGRYGLALVIAYTMIFVVSLAASVR